ncbi:MAG: Uncharacterised protein [Chloroflexota bacterium]|nr:MAG: Uncharacterised protein [Chloroflexota bacterium]
MSLVELATWSISISAVPPHEALPKTAAAFQDKTPAPRSVRLLFELSVNSNVVPWLPFTCIELVGALVPIPTLLPVTTKSPLLY